jgi:ribonuclease P protein component
LSQRHRRSDDLLVVYVAPNSCGYPRLGISVGRSLGTAAQRNRVKRLVREAFRLSQHSLPQDRDYVVMVASHWARRKAQSRKNPQAPERLTLGQVRRSFLKVVKRLESHT